MADTSAAPVEIVPGVRVADTLDGKYRIDRVVGKGGMGVVVEAENLDLHQRVAVKFLLPEAMTDPEAVARFDREGRIAAKLRSEFVVGVHDAGRLPDGGRYMVLEYLDGEDLADRVRREGPLPAREAVRLVLQASLAVVEAHALGIIHRDLKPGNLRVVTRRDGSVIVKVLDFGTYKRMPGSELMTEPHATRPGALVGTPMYASPEQLLSAPDVDVRTDVWSLGATLFELLAGRPPFEGATFAQVIHAVLSAPAPPLRTLRPDLSPGLEAVVARCLRKKPGERYASVAELAIALGETTELDAELQGLLERIMRQQHAGVPSEATRSAPRQPPVGAEKDSGQLTMPSADTVQAHGEATTAHSGTRRSKRGRLLVGAALLGAVATAAAWSMWPSPAPIPTEAGAQPTPNVSGASSLRAPSLADGVGTGASSAEVASTREQNATRPAEVARPPIPKTIEPVRRGAAPSGQTRKAPAVSEAPPPAGRQASPSTSAPPVDSLPLDPSVERIRKLRKLGQELGGTAK
ncbi:MAG: protein kinase [Polyangiaceae bacterium]|nr:protein kinase [Polyangiaceae bacterium]